MTAGPLMERRTRGSTPPFIRPLAGATQLAFAGSFLFATSSPSAFRECVTGTTSSAPRSFRVDQTFCGTCTQLPKPLFQPSEAAFEAMARLDPDRLIALLGGGLEPSDLTFAAEIAGRMLRGSVLVARLRELLNHARPVVREGALYGLAFHLAEPGVAMDIRRVAREDPSSAIRSVAADLLPSS